MKKVINIFVSIIFLISFIGVNIHKHYSQGKLYSTALFQNAESCCTIKEHGEMANPQTTCEHSQENDTGCTDKIETFKISDDFLSERSFISDIQPLVLYSISIFAVYQEETLPANFNKTNFAPYPPLIELHVQAQFGVFLI